MVKTGSLNKPQLTTLRLSETAFQSGRWCRGHRYWQLSGDEMGRQGFVIKGHKRCLTTNESWQIWSTLRDMYHRLRRRTEGGQDPKWPVAPYKKKKKIWTTASEKPAASIVKAEQPLRQQVTVPTSVQITRWITTDSACSCISTSPTLLMLRCTIKQGNLTSDLYHA